jgi:hypothetical protein
MYSLFLKRLDPDLFLAVLWIRIGFNLRILIQLFYLNADPDSDPGSQTNADSGLTLKSQKVEFLHENINKVGNREKTNIRRYKYLPCSWIQICIPNTVLDPGVPN